ncbi:MAG: hypothetical protein CVU43_14025 [Chloroflexi bacterium HGW-Chloroflexi-5]|jgi:hypothetical protein|nr:MAG: hypothetical protein CVU43_14025 [Chloroflexi bacterium HGW-Chloroflexi-5]
MIVTLERNKPLVFYAKLKYKSSLELASLLSYSASVTVVSACFSHFLALCRDFSVDSSEAFDIKNELRFIIEIISTS